MSQLITCQELNKSFGAHTLFSDLALSVHDDDRVGLIGPNGSGKSTLLRILAEKESLDSGTIFRRKQVRTVYLGQEDIFDDNKTLEETLEEVIGDDTDEIHRYNRVHRALSQAKFKDPDQKAGSLSGGWKKRLAIARALVQEPDILLLDEPTNHLDIGAILWLEKILLSAPFSFILVSHDRTFLENVTNRVVELNRCYPTGCLSIKGNYSHFLEKRLEFLEQQQVMESSLANKVRREVEWLRRGPKARTTKARYRIDEAHRLQSELAQVRGRNRSDQKVRIGFDATGRKTKKLMTVEGVSKAIDGRQLFTDLSFVLGPGVCLGMVGENGCGKSTLMHLIYGDVPPDQGTVTRADGVKIILFDQKREQLDQDVILRTALSPHGDSVLYQGSPVHVVTWAKRFLFEPDQLEMPVSRLSGGEQARILIANLMRQSADILLLDEPTNDLDIGSIQVLEESLLDFEGAVVLVSHDRSFLDTLTSTIIGFDGHGGTSLYADCHQWLASLSAGKKNDKKKKGKVKSSPKKSNKLTYKERLELEAMEKTILEAEEELNICKLKVEDPEISIDPAELSVWCNRLQECQDNVDSLYSRWGDLEKRQD
ncbi:MAG: ABC-F family ATP-binding cassette domain-containing protein [Desulfobulbaceae bacterium]|uniref:ABC-F family ATP-binding cassette domain-containing protein n=1 Tax=Candidatus Desulfobia pelagia TaxID=2841692 RepID=A0A8J6NE60_9BACT|nr:ABC-F family ATP-binding cassette domain-containing protein [Candidatus Desulfobia pelagia]